MSKHYISNKDESTRIFKNNILELLSKTSWYFPIIVYIPIISYLLYLGFANHLGFSNIIILFGTALITWTLIEYLLHRFLFHYEPKSEWGRKIHWTFHGVHHDYPMDSLRLVMPPGLSLIIASFFYIIFRFILGEVNSYPFMSGFLLGYLVYDITHYAMHHFAFRSKFYLNLKKHHMKHHFQNPHKGFGVSSIIWDGVFGTAYNKENQNNQNN